MPAPPPYRPPRLHGLADGLVDPKHYRAMGDAIWTFLWCITRQTDHDGMVLFGRHVAAETIANATGTSTKTTRRHLSRLAQGNYITLIRGSHGMAVKVNKSKKFRPKAQQRELTQMGSQEHRMDTSSAQNRDHTPVSGHDRPSEWSQTGNHIHIRSVVKKLIPNTNIGTESAPKSSRYPYRDFMGNIHVRTKAQALALPNPSGHPIVVDEEE